MIEEIEKLFDTLWPINRSLTGNGVRKTFEVISAYMEINISEAPSGKEVWSWTIPAEWNINDAYIITPEGKKVASFTESNLHVLGYSVPVNQVMSYEELAPHIYTLPEQPDVIPYLTSYYKERWGFCLSHLEFEQLPKKGDYQVYIDSYLNPNGSLTYADAVLKGESEEEIVFSTYICHPSMANNELSGPLVAVFLYNELKKLTNRHYTYRFIFVPETIGTLNYLHENGTHLKKFTKAGLIITCAGDAGKFTYKKSKEEASEINKIVSHILSHHTEGNYKMIDFSPIGSDERQYCSPGFDLPFGSLMRTMYGEYKEYHTSADNKDFISFRALRETVDIYLKVCQAIELNQKYENLQPYGEPFLTKYGLYPDISSVSGGKEDWLKQILYILNYSDGNTPLLEIAEKLNISILKLQNNIIQLRDKGLIR